MIGLDAVPCLEQEELVSKLLRYSIAGSIAAIVGELVRPTFDIDGANW